MEATELEQDKNNHNFSITYTVRLIMIWFLYFQSYIFPIVTYV